MPYVYLIGSLICVASTSIFGAFYNRGTEGKKGGPALYNFLQMLAMFVCWGVIFAVDFSFEPKVLLYSLLFAGFYTLCAVSMIHALKLGSVALTSLLLQLSLIGVTIWGFIFWNVKITPLVVSGLALVVLSLWLCLYPGKRKEKKPFNVKWLICALLMFVGNAGCSIVQKHQQLAFDGKHGALLMAAATGISALVCLIGYLRSDKTDTRLILKRSWPFPVLAGASGAALNLFVILMASSTLSPSLIYPVIAVGGLMLTTAFSAFVFKEKLRWWQWAGIAVGAAATGLLSV